VIDVLESEGVPISSIVGSSMGGLVGALHAAGLTASELRDVAQTFHFPSWFIPGGVLHWDRIFPGAAEALQSATFETLTRPLFVVATDLEAGELTVLHHGAVLPAVRASCAVPGVLAPERVNGRWLVDGALVNSLPVDVAWTADPDVVIAVSVGRQAARPMPELDWPVTSLLAKFGGAVPNPATAKVSFEVLVRASEIALGRAAALAAAMIGPEVLIEPDARDIGLRDFGRRDEAIEAGRAAAVAALPAIRRQCERKAMPRRREGSEVLLDPVCKMIVNPSRARAHAHRGDRDYFFCSENCRDCFERDPARYLRAAG
jgi:NTE family protein